MEPKEIDFEFPRGDTCPLVFDLYDEDGTEIVVGSTDEIYFTLKRSYSSSDVIVQKKFSTGGISKTDEGYKMTIMPNDTNTLGYGSYVYDICVKSGDLTRTVCLGTITLTNEATFKSNE